MWKAEQTSTINAAADKVWEVLVTPGLWTSVDPTHYKEVTYADKKLSVGGKGKMKTEDSPGVFGFVVTVVDPKTYTVTTQSTIPAGKLTISKQLVPTKSGCTFNEEVTASGPFAGLFSKIFFNKQIKATLPAQHAAIKKYVQN